MIYVVSDIHGLYDKFIKKFSTTPLQILSFVSYALNLFPFNNAYLGSAE